MKTYQKTTLTNFSHDSLFFIYGSLMISISLLISFLFYFFSNHEHVSLLDPNNLWQTSVFFSLIALFIFGKEFYKINRQNKS